MDDTPHPPHGSEAVFDPVDIDRIADAVVEQVEELIVLGVLRPGARLPAERDLAEVLNISRPKLREAIRVLEARGLVRTRRGEGAFVEPLTGALMTPPLAALCNRHPSATGDFIAVRRELESYAAHLAARRATPADHEALSERLAAMEATLETDDTRAEGTSDLAFHLTVVEAAHNVVLLHVMRALYDLMCGGLFRHRDLFDGDPHERRILFDQHRAIAEAIASGDATAAASASEAHLDHVAQVYRATADLRARSRIATKRLRVARLSGGAAELRRRR